MQIQDAGEKIGGARKDFHARALDLADLDSMTNDEAVRAVRKDAIWPAPDYQKLVDDGCEPMAAALIKAVRDRMAATPNFTSPSLKAAEFGPEDARRLYVDMVGRVRDAFMAVKTVGDADRLYDRLLDDIGWDRSSRNQDAEVKALLFSIYKGRSCPFLLDTGARSTARTLVDGGFPAKIEGWERGVTYRASGGEVIAIKGSRVIARGADRDEARAAAHKAIEQGAAKKADGPTMPPDRPHLDAIEREGLEDVREGRDIHPQEFIDKLGFRGIEFGNWVANDERQTLLNMAWEALHDLADVINVPVECLSLDGRLALAFGARGRGRHAAHYEPGLKVFNFTKLSGAGTAAHEWFHAFDHWVAESEGVIASEHVRMMTGGQHHGADLDRILAHLKPDERNAAKTFTGLLLSRQRSKEEQIERLAAQIAECEGNVSKYTKMRADHVSSSASPNKKWLKDVDRYLAGQRDRIHNLHLASRETEAKPADGEFGRTATNYAQEARKLCGKSGTYYLEPTELGARAFESFVFDAIADRKGRSDYLVYGVEPDRYEDPEIWKGNPYPTGAERLALNAAASTMMEAFRERLLAFARTTDAEPTSLAPVPG